MNTADNIGEAIKNSRIKKMMTQEELAEILDVTPTHIKHLESGHRKPSVPVLFTIAKTLDMSIDNIIFSNKHQNEKTIAEINNRLQYLSDNELNIILDLTDSIKKNKI